MSWAIGQVTVNNLMEIQSNCEYQISLIANSLQALAMQSASVTQQQTAASQAYLAQHTDEEGEIDMAAIEYANSEAFNAFYNRQLKSIQAKEQILNMQKSQLELRAKTATTEIESWEKNKNSSIEKFCKYGN